MNKKWLFDTDVLIDYLRGSQKASTFLTKVIEDSICYLSVITVAELYAGVREGEERAVLENFLNAFEIVTLNENMSRDGGLHRRDHGKSHGVGLADALIAATAISCDATLVTLNKKHFPMLQSVHVPYSK